MGFLAPALLALGAAVAVPLILHLLHRQQGPRLVFPALRYLRRAEKENARRIKLRQILLMALRLAVIVLLVLAASRPFIHSGGSGHVPTAVAIILDNSLSTGLVVGEERVLDQLKARALETLARARPEDRFWLIRAASPWDPAVMSEPSVAAELVRQTEVSAGRADIGAALTRARSLLAAGAEGRATEIHLLTDLQASSFGAAGQIAGGEGGGRAGPPLLIWGPDGSPPENVGIAELNVGGGIAPRAGERSTIAISLTGTGTRDSIPVRLVISDRVAAAAAATPGATTLLTFPPRTSGIVTGHVELDPDALRGDDVRYFAVHLRPAPRVALAGRPAFIADALDVLDDAGRIEVVSGAGADVVIAPGGAGLEALAEGSTAVVIAPTAATELPAVNRRLAEAGIPWRFAPPTGGGESRLETEGLDDEILASLEDVRIREVYELRPEGEADHSPLITLRDGRVWAARGELADGRRYILVASPLSTQATTLPTSPALILLLDRLTGVWAADSPPRTEVAPGSTITIPAGATAVALPDGTNHQVAPGAGYRVPARPGIYQVLAGERVIDAFAVNPDPAESDLTRLDDRGLRAALPGWRTERVNDPGAWADTIFRQRLGREVWRPLLLAALAFLLLEGLVAASGAGRSTDESGRAPTRGGPSRPDRVPVPAAGSGAGEVVTDRRTS